MPSYPYGADISWTARIIEKNGFGASICLLETDCDIELEYNSDAGYQINGFDADGIYISPGHVLWPAFSLAAERSREWITEKILARLEDEGQTRGHAMGRS